MELFIVRVMLCGRCYCPNTCQGPLLPQRGAIDGKHIVVQAPACSGSTFFNYKGTHSIMLMAVCDAHYCFTLVDIGDAGRHSDGGVFSNSAFGQAMEGGELSLPDTDNISGISLPPYFFCW